MGKSEKKKSRRSSKSKRSAVLTAKTADKHWLYEKSVQDSKTELKFLDRAVKRLGRPKAMSLREDFCGTAIFCGAFIQSHPERTAVGVDLDQPTLDYGVEKHLSKLGEPGKRIQLFQQDVRDPTPQPVDVVCAYNFSYWVFKTRDELRGYFEKVRAALKPDGVFLLDAYGGTESGQVMKEDRWIEGGFTYVWHQAKFDPITHDVVNHIHFKFKDGTRLKKAFTYEWRFWTLPEIRELLTEAGFKNVSVFWDVAGDDENSKHRVVTNAKNQAGWVCYLGATAG